MKEKCPKLKISEVISYLGCKQIDDLLEQQLKEMMELITKISDPKIVYRIFPLVNHECLEIELSGNDIKKLLASCDEVLLMVASLGMRVDQSIKRLEKQDMGKAYVLNACANAMIEAVCDEFNDQIAKQYEKNNRYLTDRFSCGYGDLPIEMQNDLISLLNATKRIGVYVSDTHLLIPSKSVSAIIGISDVKQPMIIRGCQVCRMNHNCLFRKGGKRCGQ